MINFLNITLDHAQLIKSVMFSEKSLQLLKKNQYSFVINPQWDKKSIKKTVEYLFNVKVTKINTCHLPRKKRRVNKFTGWKPQYKKVIVTLSKNDRIQLFTYD